MQLQAMTIAGFYIFNLVNSHAIPIQLIASGFCQETFKLRRKSSCVQLCHWKMVVTPAYHSASNESEHNDQCLDVLSDLLSLLVLAVIDYSPQITGIILTQ